LLASNDWLIALHCIGLDWLLGLTHVSAAVGYYSVWFVWGFLVLLLPLSYPISKILDLLLGREIGTVYSKEEVRLARSNSLA